MGRGLHAAVVDGETMGKEQQLSLSKVGKDLSLEDFLVAAVREQDRNEVGPLNGGGYGHGCPAFLGGPLPGRSPLAQDRLRWHQVV